MPRRTLLGVATLLVVLLAMLRALDPLPEGLHATYFSDANWSSPPVWSGLESRPSTDRLAAFQQANPLDKFSAVWTGSFIALHEDTYSFGANSDDGAWVYIDGQLVADDGGQHGVLLATGTVRLERGVHTIFVKYFQSGGLLHLDLVWARGAGKLDLMPAWSLSTRHVTFSRFLASVVLRRTFNAAVVLWLVALLSVVGVPLWRWWMRALGVFMSEPIHMALAGVVVGSCLLTVTGIWWGLPGSWAGDEITPSYVLVALSRHFTGGWFEKYPPVHFYVLSAAFSPWLLLKSLVWVRVSDTFESGLLLLMARLVSALEGAGILMAVYACGADAFGKRAGLFAAAAFAVLTPFLYYAKTANVEVPYVLWFTVSLVFYVRFARTRALRDAVLLAATAALAVCTKDQAYGLYLAVPFVIVYEAWRSNREQRIARPLLRATFGNAPLGLAALAGTAVFIACQNLPSNITGFIDHIRYITGPGSQPYRVVEPTVGGRLALLRLTTSLDQMSWGWPMFLISLIGMVAALTRVETRKIAVWLLALVAGYYIGFIDVILYLYDRFLLPICVVQALFAGVALDALSKRVGRVPQVWRLVLVGGVFAYTILYATTVDVLMLRDSRYTVERWLTDHAGPDRLLGTALPPYVLPRFTGLRSKDIGTVEDLEREAPDEYVLNADYARAVPADAPLGRLIYGLQHETLGYRLVFRYRSPPPWPWLPAAHHDLVGPRQETEVYSVLRDINPTIEIYQR